MESTPDSVANADVLLIHRATGLPILASRDFLRDAIADGRANRILDAMRTQEARRPFHDPIEDSPEHAAAFAEADTLVDAEFDGVPYRRGHCYSVWAARKRILLERFGIDWLTPQEMNPGSVFD